MDVDIGERRVARDGIVELDFFEYIIAFFDFAGEFAHAFPYTWGGGGSDTADDDRDGHGGEVMVVVVVVRFVEG